MKNTILLQFFALLLFMASCGNTDKHDKQHYTIASLRGPSSIGMIYLIDSLNNTDNATFEIEILNDPLQVRKMMLDGSADFAVLPTTMAALMYNKGVDYRLEAISTWGTLFMCGNDTTIQSWSGLKNKKVYLMAKNMTPDVLSRHLMEKNGLKPYIDVDLDYRFHNHIDLANATTAGLADISVLSEPYLSYTLINNPNMHVLMSLHDEWYKIYGYEMPETAFICKGEIAEGNRQLVNGVVNLYKTSVEKVKENIIEAAALAVKYQIVADTTAAANSIPRSNLKVIHVDKAKKQVVDYLNVFYKMDPLIIGGKMPDEKFY